MEKGNLKIEPKKCTHCYCCQLYCSFMYTGNFNPEKAKIIIDLPNRISFTEECIEGCSLCTEYCPTEAIVVRE